MILSDQYHLSRYNGILAKLSNKIEPNQELIDVFVEKYDASYGYNASLNTFVKNILRNANIDTKYQIYEKMGTDLNLNIDDIESFNNNQKLKLLSTFRNSNIAIKYIDDNFTDLLDNSDYKLLINTLYSLYEYSIDTNKKLIIELLDRIPYTYYVKQLLINNRFIYTLNEFDPKIFFEYFRIDYEIDVKDIEKVIQ